uniref:Family with sequence similarity 83 member D n=1 Tax=Latimeria chalumnae TaxID=7897 RepID=H3B639_LATCH
PSLQMAGSQCLDDLPRYRRSAPANELSLRELYNEAHRLALEELISGGREAFGAFLKREQLQSFLSEAEVGALLESAQLPVYRDGEDGALDQSVTSSLDCSSVTYFPEQSDIEPPVLELGWTGFHSGSYRGVTRAEVHFQPSYGENIYSCKEAIRKLIKSAKEVVALVMDSFTDLDIFRDLQETCNKRRIPVYILLDHSSLSQFLQMCQNLQVSLEDEKNMRVRTITGATYYTRSGAKIIGKVHEKFLLVDGIKAATGSYSFMWTDGKLNSSTVTILSGHVVERFDLEFRMLYAQSKPVNPKRSTSCRNSDVHNRVINKMSPLKRAAMDPCLGQKLESMGHQMSKVLADVGNRGLLKGTPASESSTLGEEAPNVGDWLQDSNPEAQQSNDGFCQMKSCSGKPFPITKDAFTQTSIQTTCRRTQTTVPVQTAATQTAVCVRISTTQTDSIMKTCPISTTSSLEASQPCFRSAASSEQCSLSKESSATCSSSNITNDLKGVTTLCKRSDLHVANYNLRNCFQKLTKERQYHYSTIRSKLDHMVTLLSRRQQLVNPKYFGCSAERYNAQYKNEAGSKIRNIRDVALLASLS